MGSRAEKLGLLCSGLSALNWERTMKSSAEIARQIEIPRRSEKTPALVLSSNDQPTEPDLDGIRKRLHLNLPLAPRQAHPWTSSSRFRSGIAFFFLFLFSWRKWVAGLPYMSWVKWDHARNKCWTRGVFHHQHDRCVWAFCCLNFIACHNTHLYCHEGGFLGGRHRDASEPSYYGGIRLRLVLNRGPVIS